MAVHRADDSAAITKNRMPRDRAGDCLKEACMSGDGIESRFFESCSVTAKLFGPISAISAVNLSATFLP